MKNIRDETTKKIVYVPSRNDIDGVPIVNKYKYLGYYLDCKLTVDSQIDFIEKKSNFLWTRLYPYLSNASADGRRDMWKTMVMPLFNAVFTILNLEKSLEAKDKVLRLWISTFKRFLMIPKNTSTLLVGEMIGTDIDELIETYAKNATEKWLARKERRDFTTAKSVSINLLKGISNDWCTILKQQFGLCYICRNSIKSAKHMELVHQTEILSYQDIWEDIKNYFIHKLEELKKIKKKHPFAKLSRTSFITKWKPLLKKAKDEFQKRLDTVYSVKKKEETD